MTGRNSVRRLQSPATRALAAELGHEIQGGISFFRLMAERLSQGHQLDAEELSAFSEELTRFSALSARLRDFARAPLTRADHTARAVLEAACALVAAAERPLPLELVFEGDEQVQLHCDLELLAQGLAALIDNALEARADRAGVTISTADGVTIEVWDDGPGFEQGTTAALSWGSTSRPGALGLGLTLALRSARAHGFSLELEREPERELGRLPARTRARLVVPARDVLSGQAKLGA